MRKSRIPAMYQHLKNHRIQANLAIRHGQVGVSVDDYADGTLLNEKRDRWEHPSNWRIRVLL
jgi:hypothetical protein